MKKVTPTDFPQPLIKSANDFGEAVRAARTGCLMTIADAALCFNVSKQTIQNIELGKGTVSLGLALRVAHGMGVSVFAVPSSQRRVVNRPIETIDHPRGNQKLKECQASAFSPSVANLVVC